MPGASMMLLAAETAKSLLEPMTKLSRVYLELRPLLSMDWSLVALLRVTSTCFLIVVASDLVTSRGRTLDLTLDWTSKLTDFTSILLFLRAVVMRSR